MNWMERMNAAINYLEEHITEELDFSEVAKAACCSTYHFQRMFASMTDMTLPQYIRRRRMSLAVTDLKSDGVKIIDVALKYGYNSPTAFNRAFQEVHGIAPSFVKLDGVFVKSYPPISFHISVKGAEALDYRIEKKAAFRTVGISTLVSNDIEANWDISNQLWQAAEKNGTLSKLSAMMDTQPAGLFEFFISDNPGSLEDTNLRYYIAVSSTKETGGKWEEYIMPSFTWAIFPADDKHPETGMDLWRRIISEWFPASGYEFDSGPGIDLTINDNSQKTKFEVWVPIKKSE